MDDHVKKHVDVALVEELNRHGGEESPVFHFLVFGADSNTWLTGSIW